MNSKNPKSIAVIVAHPDDETLWAGGTILKHKSNNWFILCLSRGSDKVRAPRFYNTLKLLKANGIMGDLEDGPNQEPIDEQVLETEILKLLPPVQYDLIITHNPTGEYTRHLRHEEVSKAVIGLWHNEKITANELWTFAYNDGNKEFFPKAVKTADIYESLTEKIWLKKYKIMTETYGFDMNSWEAQTTPLEEAFWKFKNSHQAIKSMMKTENELNIFQNS